MTVAEAARRLRVSTATVYKLVASGAIPHVRVGSAIRISAKSLPADAR